MKEILQHPNEVLRATAQEVPVEDITTQTIQEEIADMQEALAGESDGVAIAAPQIGISKRIFVVSGKVFREYEDDPMPKDAIFINPETIKVSKEKEWMDEGCLSVRPKYGKVERSLKATIRAYNEKGERIERGASGLLAQIFQHETDHLNGILFIDSARDVYEPTTHNE